MLPLAHRERRLSEQTFTYSDSFFSARKEIIEHAAEIQDNLIKFSVEKCSCGLFAVWPGRGREVEGETGGEAGGNWNTPTSGKLRNLPLDWTGVQWMWRVAGGRAAGGTGLASQAYPPPAPPPQ